MPGWALKETFRWGADEVAFETLGQGEAAVVLVHGFPGNSFAWREVAPQLAESRRVFVVDMLGFGQSTQRHEQDVSQQAQAELLAALLEYWELPRPDIVGHDIGASYALGALLFHDRSARRLILIDAAALNPSISENSLHARRYLEAYQTMPPLLHETILRSHIPTTMFTPMSEATFAAYFRPWRGPGGQAAYYRFLAQLDTAYFDRLEESLEEVRIPTRIVWGAEDNWIPLAHAERLAELVPNSEIAVIPEAGHFVTEDAPAAVTEAIRSFLDPA
jgi:pimeloyl-ACP methyl ester carboxylesterase